MSILPKLIIVAKTIPIKIPAKFLVNTDKIILKCIWEEKGTKKPKIILKKKNKVGRIHLPNATTYFIVTAIKIMWYWWWDRNIDQWNITENLNIHKYAYIIFDKGRKAIQQEGLPFQQMVMERLNIHEEKWTLTYLTPYTKN